MRGAHVCMSGNMECSGVDPCDPCASATMTYVLVPAMKAAGIDQRNDPRVASFLRTYAEARKHLVNGLHAQAAQAAPPPPPMAPRPSRPPVADLPLTEAELEAMAHPAPHATIAAPSASLVDPPMAGGPDEPGHSYDYAAQDAQQAARPASPPAPLPPSPEPPTPAGLMTDEEFAAKFPKAAPEELMVMPPKPELQPEPEPSILKLASQAITPKIPDDQKVIYQDSDSVVTTPKLPVEEPASDTSEVGSAPTQPAPLSAPTPQAPTEDVSAVALGANNQAEPATKAEASTHGG